MSYQTRPTYSDFETANHSFAERLSCCLQNIVADEPTHARFLNTLSMLEHMGARRIMITQSNLGLRQDVLKHMAEEARHAFFFKRQADKFAGKSLDYHPRHLIAPAFARLYFKRLESFIAQDMRREENPTLITYLCMSLIIEYRAIWAFGLFQKTLDDAKVILSLKSLLSEEKGHLADMETALADHEIASASRLASYFSKEQALFTKLLGSFEKGVA